MNKERGGNLKSIGISRSKILELAKRKGCIVNSNISYKEQFHPKDMITVTHSCGMKSSMKLKKFRHFVCTCTPHVYMNTKFCLICNKPNRGRTQLCTICKTKAKQLDVSTKKLVYICEVFDAKDPFAFLEENPCFITKKIDYTKATELKRERRKVQTSKEFKSSKHKKWTEDVPQYIYDLFKGRPHFEFVTLDGHKANPNIYYHCKKCNKEHCQPFNHLKTKSHNCEGQKSSGEVIIESFLSNMSIPFKTQHQTIKCLNPKTNRQLPYDIEVLGKKVLIEIQGEQHFKFIEVFHGTIENFEYQRFRDEYKKEFAEKEGYQLIYIDYKEIKKGTYQKKIMNILGN
jgi:hypothetical protein